MNRIIASVFISICAAGTVFGKGIYEPAHETKGKRALLLLPAGAVKPNGWLLDRARTAAKGNIGNMERCDVAFVNAWMPFFCKKGNDLHWGNMEHGGWAYEGGGYWFDGLTRLAYELNDPALIAKAKAKFDGVATNMTDQGYGFLWWLTRKDGDMLKQIPPSENYWIFGPYGCLGRSMAAYSAASGDPRYLTALAQAFRFDPRVLSSGWSGITPQAAVEAYELTGDKGIAACLDTVYAEALQGRGRLHFAMPGERLTGENQTGANHGVTLLETLLGSSYGYLWTGDRRFADCAAAWMAKIDQLCMQPYGAPVFDESYRPAGAYIGTETCDIAARQWLDIQFLSMLGSGRFGDSAERVFFNAGPLTITRDFIHNVYFQEPNRPRSRHDKSDYQVRHWPLCCTAAIARILPHYIQSMWMATADNGLAATLYGPCEVSASVADGTPVQIKVSTDYPFGETIRMALSPAKAVRFPLSLRIPDWCAAPSLALNGQNLPLQAKNGFVRLEREWNPSDTLTLSFPMTVRVASGVDRGNPALNFAYKGYDWNAKPTFAAPYASVYCGPLCFVLGIPEATPDENVPDAKFAWQYALAPNALDAKLTRNSMPSFWDWPFNAPVKLTVNAFSAAWQHNEAQPRLPKPEEIHLGAPARLTLIPYGCARFRISMFPLKP